MGYLAGNGTKLYRRVNSLVRSPIYESVTLPLVVDRMVYYPVCGEYASVGGDRSPGRGFCSQPGLITEGDCKEQGWTMRKAFLGVGSSAFQGWWNWNLLGGPKPYVFLQGRYGVTAANNFCCEAFLQVPAYHFTIPAQYDGYEVVSAALGVTHYGVICAYQQAGTAVRCGSDTTKANYYAAEAPSNILAADSNWRNDIPFALGVYGDGITGMTIAQVHNAATDSVTMNTSRTANDLRYTQGGDTYTQTAQISPIIGNVNLSYASDKLAVSPNPWTQAIALSEAAANNISRERGGWVCITPDVSYTSEKESANDYPAYNCSVGWGRWLACSFGNYNLTVALRRQIG